MFYIEVLGNPFVLIITAEDCLYIHFLGKIAVGRFLLFKVMLS